MGQVRPRVRRLGTRAGHDALALLRYHRSGLYSLAVLVGLLAGAGAIAFRLGIDAWSQVLAGGAGEELQPDPSSGLLAWGGRWYLLAAPVVSGALIGPIMTRLGRTSTGHGVAGVIWSARRSDGAMAPRPAAASVVSAALTIGGGGSVGPEGPIAELGASAASSVGHRLGLPARSVRMLAAAGTAAGIASAFNAPLAGAFFAMEVVLLDFTVDAFAFMVLACVSSTVLTHLVLGQAVTMSLPDLGLAPAAIDASLGWAALLGVLGGMVGVLFSRTRYLAGDAVAWLRAHTRLPLWATPAVGGLAVGAVLMIFPQAYGESSLVLDRLLAGDYGAGVGLGLAGLKIVATALTLAVGFAGGVFAPSLFIGGALGAAFGAFVSPGLDVAPALFGVLGMCAVFTGAGRAPITAVILIIEMTGQYALLLPLMLVSVLATFISRLLTRTSIYTEELRRRGDDVEDPRDQTLVGRACARDLMTSPPAMLRAGDSLARAAAVLHASGSAVLPVIADDAEDDREPSSTGCEPDPVASHGPAGVPASPVPRGGTPVLLGCVSAVQVAEASLAGAALPAPKEAEVPGPGTASAHTAPSARSLRVGDLPLTSERVEASADGTSVLALLTSTGADGLPVVREGLDGSVRLVGWIAQQDMVRRLYRHQRAASDAARQRTSLGARVQAYLRARCGRRG